MDVSKLKKPVLKEIALLALTYRVSNKNLASLLDTSSEEIREALNDLIEFQIPLYWLRRETEFEDEIDERVAYIHAQNYLNKRKKLMKELKVAKETKDEEKIKEAQANLKEHFKEIDDTFVSQTIGKRLNELTTEEREAISKFRLKYGLAKRVCSKELGRPRKTIDRLDQELAEKNPIFRDKVELLNAYWDDINKNCAIEIAKEKYNKR